MQGLTAIGERTAQIDRDRHTAETRIRIIFMLRFSTLVTANIVPVA